MNNWAASGRYDCHFLCVCVVGDGAYPLAREMSKQMKLKNCVNGFVDSDDDMPTYGQLGCSGFIILDDKHQVVAKSTSSFMEVKNLAFQHVEALLDAVVAKRPLPRICPGEQVVLRDPPANQPRLKGAQGICVKLEADTVGFAFLSGPFRGKMMDVPASSVVKPGYQEQEVSRGGGCGPSGCGPGACGPGGCGPADCGPGGCDNGIKSDSGNGKTLKDLDAAFVEAALDIQSVKVPSMDAEHDECASAMRQLAEKGSSEALQGVLDCMSEHFGHEEQLFEVHGFGNHKNERLAAKKTHMADHNRILNKVRHQLASCNGYVPATFVRELLQDFDEHTARYDMQYADFLSAKGVQ
mmetsp:Transcript_10610/g.20529  ORF Transcript_10610/g.20529 Transcript_10610/m.20529 type:complete len:353 (-) Transcript_10610:50-1108(-)